VADGRRRALHSPITEKENEKEPHKPAAEPSPHHDTSTNTHSHKEARQDAPQDGTSSSRIQSLLNMAHILYDPIRIPRYPIVLCHGLYGWVDDSSCPAFYLLAKKKKKKNKIKYET
jgi:hypothetical protein